MKEGGSGVLMMAAVSPTAAAYLFPAMVGPTPSPFSFSVASTRWSSSRPSIRISSLFLRAMVLVFSFASSLALAATMSKKSFQEYPELVGLDIKILAEKKYHPFFLLPDDIKERKQKSESNKCRNGNWKPE